MATKAEQFQMNEVRARPKTAKPKKHARPRKPDPMTAKPGTARSRRTPDGNKATFALESMTPEAKPSRKSTRRSANHAKPDSNLQRRQAQRVGSPKARAAKSTARAKKAGHGKTSVRA